MFQTCIGRQAGKLGLCTNQPSSLCQEQTETVMSWDMNLQECFLDQTILCGYLIISHYISQSTF